MGESKPFNLEKKANNTLMSFEDSSTGLDLWGLLTPALRGTIGINRISWSRDGLFIAAACRDGAVRIWEIPDQPAFQPSSPDTSHVHEGEVYGVVWSADGRYLASGSGDWSVYLRDNKNPRASKRLSAPHGSAYSLAFYTFKSHGPLLAAGYFDGTIIIWDTKSGRAFSTIPRAHLGGVNTLSWSPDGSLLASGGNDGRIRLWTVSGRHPAVVKFTDDSSGPVMSLSWESLHGNWIASGSRDGLLRIWHPEEDVMHRFEGHGDLISRVAVSRNSKFLATKSNDNTIGLWNCANWKFCCRVEERVPPAAWHGGMVFNPIRPLLASLGKEDSVIRVWKVDRQVLQIRSRSQAGEAISTCSAKVALVGEANVGKSYLTHRIVNDAAPGDGEILATHGMQFWRIDPEQLGPEETAPPCQRRDIVIWDMGGQPEYRLIHQLFLQDITVALVLFDPTRGPSTFNEVEAWNKYLEKNLRGKNTVKLLVGSKVDHPSDTINQSEVQRLVTNCGFGAYIETSAITGRGVTELRKAIGEAIDWNKLGQTSRPDLYQRIRDKIEELRMKNQVVMSVSELHSALGHLPTNDEQRAVEAVAAQLSTHGLIARSRVSNGEPMLVLRVQEIERFGGSLILAARNNRRGVPALELRAILAPEFDLPGISGEEEELTECQAKSIIECTVQLMLDCGICFEHQGLLIFPSLFDSILPGGDGDLTHAISLYYDFAGAIENIYASLIARLVLAQDFGSVRLWSDRAEFDAGGRGLYGLRKVNRKNGFARMDVYFSKQTKKDQRNLFIDFVNEHLEKCGVEVREHVAVECACGHQFLEETLRLRIARGEKDVLCPICETRHNLTDAARERKRDTSIAEKTWALLMRMEGVLKEATNRAFSLLGSVRSPAVSDRIHILHLSDLHFTEETPVRSRIQWLEDDLKMRLKLTDLDYLVVSGDFTDRGGHIGFEKAYEFVSELIQIFGLSAERCVFVPGNHDLCDIREAYDWRDTSAGLRESEWVRQGEIVLAKNPEKYPLRFKRYSDVLYHKFFQSPYPLDSSEQGVVASFWDTGIQFMSFNSSWQIDQFHRRRSGINSEAVAKAIKSAQTQEVEARKSGKLGANKPLLRIATWHHSVAGPDQMRDTDFIGHLQSNGVRLILHGDVHELRHDMVGYLHDRNIHVIGSGSFGSPPGGRPESIPRLYNVIAIDQSLLTATVYTRRQFTPDGPWDAWYAWPIEDGRAAAHFDIDLR